MFNLANFKPKKKKVGLYLFLVGLYNELFAIKEISKEALNLKTKLKQLF